MTAQVLPQQQARRGPAVARWRLHEPVRFYLFLALGVLLLALGVAAAVTGEWRPYALAAVLAVAVLLPAIRAARASVYSAPGVIREMARVRAGG